MSKGPEDRLWGPSVWSKAGEVNREASEVTRDQGESQGLGSDCPFDSEPCQVRQHGAPASAPLGPKYSQGRSLGPAGQRLSRWLCFLKVRSEHKPLRVRRSGTEEGSVRLFSPSHTHPAGPWAPEVVRCGLCPRPQPRNRSLVKEGDLPADRDSEAWKWARHVGAGGREPFIWRPVPQGG